MTSFYTSLSGLNAAQLDLNTTSNNIANVGTTGFKSSRAEFGDLISSSAFSSQTANIGQGTRLKSISQEFSQGASQTTSRALDLMVGGEGFFVTKSQGSGNAVSYTRDGAFSVDGENNVVDSSGNALQVLPVDTFGNVTASGLTASVGLHVSPTHGSAAATTSISQPVTFPSSASQPATTTFSANDPTSYNYATSITAYDAAGNAVPATTYFARNADNADGSSSWTAHTFVGDQEAFPTGTTAAATLSFGTDGTMTTNPATIAYGAVTPTGAASPMTISVDYASSKQGDYAFQTISSSQNGKTVAKLNNLSVDSNGLVSASYADGATVELGKVALATFSNPAGLHQAGNTTWTATANSGAADIGEADQNGKGKITSGALELSNVDLTSQLVNLISAQRNFQANAKAIDTDKQMLSYILNLQ